MGLDLGISVRFRNIETKETLHYDLYWWRKTWSLAQTLVRLAEEDYRSKDGDWWYALDIYRMKEIRDYLKEILKDNSRDEWTNSIWNDAKFVMEQTQKACREMDLFLLWWFGKIDTITLQLKAETDYAYLEKIEKDKENWTVAFEITNSY